MYDSPWKKHWQPCITTAMMKPQNVSPLSRNGANVRIGHAEQLAEDDAQDDRHGDRLQQRPADADDRAPVAVPQIDADQGHPEVPQPPDLRKVAGHQSLPAQSRCNPCLIAPLEGRSIHGFRQTNQCQSGSGTVEQSFDDPFVLGRCACV